MKESVADEIFLLDASQIEFFVDEQLQIGLRNKSDGSVVTGLRLALMFPITDRTSYIQFFDDQGQEVGILQDVNQLDKQSRTIVLSEIAKTYFIPEITRIIDISTELGADVWQVETNKGLRKFEVVGKRRNIRYITADHVMIKDLDGNRYEIPKVMNLDSSSKRLLQREV